MPHQALKTTMFDDNQMNALAQAIVDVSEAKDFNDEDYQIYEYFDQTPKTSLVVEIVQALNKLGYKIAP